MAGLCIHRHGPWIVAGIVALLALHRLRLDRFAATSGAWGLLGWAAV
jgi:hypothetical protein